MTRAERRATAGLSIIFGLRMLGLFFIMPVFALYAGDLAGASPALIGTAIGAYGLTQALLQVPMGMLSDRIGRKPVIVGGLLLFAAGSVLAALSGSIYGVIAGRALQGCGAIAAAVMALAADMTRETQRTKIMAFIGVSAGLAFMAALIAAPVVAGLAGLSGLFWASAGFALLSLLLLAICVPGRYARVDDRKVAPGALRKVLRHPDLLRLNASVLALHLVVTAGFVVLPLVLQRGVGLTPPEHWKVWVPVMLASVLPLFLAIRWGEARGCMNRLVAGTVVVLALGELALADSLHTGPWAVMTGLVVYLAAVNILEACLPSLVSRFAPAQAKGAALGVFSTFQFTGAFLGGVLGGWIFGLFDAEGVFVFCATVAAVWFVLVLGLRAPSGAGAESGLYRQA